MMRMRSKALVGIVCGVLAGGIGIGVAAPQASAQMRMGFGAGRAGGMGERMISESDLAQYTKILKLDAAQSATAKDLYDAYASEYQQARKQLQDAIDKIRAEFEDTRDPSVWQKDMPAAAEKFGNKTNDLEKALMGDIKMLLNQDQAANWDTMERAHRRNRSLPSGMLSGESTDLVKIVEGLKIEQPPEALVQTLDRYENELDAALTERDAKRKDLSEQMPGFGGRGGGGGGGGGGGFMGMDFEKIQQVMTDMRKSGIKVRDINDRFASVIESSLPEDKRSTFSEKVRSEKFPQIYREPYVLKAASAALKFDDLTPEQKSTIEAAKESYERSLAGVNEKWARAVADAEKDGGGDDMMGGFMRMMRNEEGGDDSELSQARKARRKLDSDTLDKIKQTLTEDQVDRLPERESDRNFQMFGGPRR